MAVYLAFSFSALLASLAASSALSAALSALSSALSAASLAFSAACSLSSGLFAGSLLPPQAVRAKQAMADVSSRGFRMVSAISSWRAKRGAFLRGAVFPPAAPPGLTNVWRTWVGPNCHAVTKVRFSGRLANEDHGARVTWFRVGRAERFRDSGTGRVRR